MSVASDAMITSQVDCYVHAVVWIYRIRILLGIHRLLTLEASIQVQAQAVV